MLTRRKASSASRAGFQALAIFVSTMRAHRGAIAQLGERLHGMQEVGGSIPPGSTIPYPPCKRSAKDGGGRLAHQVDDASKDYRWRQGCGKIPPIEYAAAGDALNYFDCNSNRS